MLSLKKIRVILALVFFVVITLVFVDFRGDFGKNLYSYAAYMQFVPSLLKTITVPGVIGFGFIVVLILTLLFGRVYCSVICPLGVFQDIVSWFSKRINKRHRYKLRKAWTVTRYAILGVSVFAVIAGSITLITLFDPYSIFGRTGSYVLKPVLIWINNIGATVFNSFDIYSILYRYDNVAVKWEIMMVTGFFLVLAIVMSSFRGRLYCNSVCPVGTFLGLMSRISLFKIELEKNACTRCGKCARVCKAECIDVKNREIDYSRCVACYNCIPVCPENAAIFRVKKKDKGEAVKSVETDMGKRNFVTVLGLGVAALLGSGTAKRSLAQGHLAQKNGNSKGRVSNDNLLPEKKNHPVSPPGSESIELFNDICTGCSLCVTACPTKVLQPSMLHYGLIGLLQPHMDFYSGLCNFDCTVCGEVCPTGAIKPLTMEKKHITQIGRAKFVKQNCVVETEGTDCGACSEHCPTKAVHMIPYGDLLLPEVTEELCVGCGACEFACPLEPGVKAIYVDGNPEHLVAEKPEVEKAKIELEEDEFPF